MANPVALDPAVAKTFIKYARLVSARGYVHNTLGNIVIRVPHPDFPHGVAYTKHAELSLEEMEAENIVVTDIPSSRVLLGTGSPASATTCRARSCVCVPTSRRRSMCTTTRCWLSSARAPTAR
jgi:hypothetical protein